MGHVRVVDVLIVILLGALTYSFWPAKKKALPAAAAAPITTLSPEVMEYIDKKVREEGSLESCMARVNELEKSVAAFQGRAKLGRRMVMERVTELNRLNELNRRRTRLATPPTALNSNPAARLSEFDALKRGLYFQIRERVLRSCGP